MEGCTVGMLGRVSIDQSSCYSLVFSLEIISNVAFISCIQCTKYAVLHSFIYLSIYYYYLVSCKPSIWQHEMPVPDESLVEQMCCVVNVLGAWVQMHQEIGLF